MNARLFSAIRQKQQFRSADQTTMAELLRNHPDFTTALGGEGWLITHGNISHFGNRPRMGKIDLSIPGQLLEKVIDQSGCPIMPYGEWFTTKIIRQIFRRDWLRHSYCIIPGEYWFEEYSELHFSGLLHPGTHNASSLLVVADSPMVWYGGAYGLTTMNLDYDLFGLVMPLSFTIDEKIFVGQSITEIYEVMEYGLKNFLAASATAV